MEAILRNLQTLRSIVRRTEVGITYHSNSEFRNGLGVMGCTATGYLSLVLTAFTDVKYLCIGGFLFSAGGLFRFAQRGMKHDALQKQYKEIDQYAKSMLKYNDHSFDIGSAESFLADLEQETAQLKKQTFFGTEQRTPES